MNSELPPPIPPCGDDEHEWKFVDDSFDHEFGTERIYYYRCEKCGAMQDAVEGQNDFDDYPDVED